MSWTTKAMIAAGALTLGTPASAATPIIDEAGMLTGATGVTVGADTYTVRFVDGTCAAVYGSCTASAFDFQDRNLARLAAQALLDQVFLNIEAGAFDDDPGLTAGCRATQVCLSGIPVDSLMDTAIVAVNNRPGNTNAVVAASLSIFSDTRNIDALTFVRFYRTDVAAVPEPAGWATMLVGFAMAGAAFRRRRRRSRIFIGS